MPELDVSRVSEALCDAIYEAAIKAGACPQTAEALAEILPPLADVVIPYVCSDEEAGYDGPSEPDRHGWEER